MPHVSHFPEQIGEGHCAMTRSVDRQPRDETSLGLRRLKKTYAAPHLTVYGNVKALVQAGTGTSFENGQPGNCSQNKNAKSCLSDRRTKQEIVRIGAHPSGVGIYLFNYKPEFRDTWGHGRQFGVMADEVEAVMPEAVCVHPDGYKMVDYAMLGITQGMA